MNVLSGAIAIGLVLVLLLGSGVATANDATANDGGTPACEVAPSLTDLSVLKTPASDIVIERALPGIERSLENVGCNPADRLPGEDGT